MSEISKILVISIMALVIFGSVVVYAISPEDPTTFYGKQTFRIMNKYHTEDTYYVDIITVDSRCTNHITHEIGYGAMKSDNYKITKSAWDDTHQYNYIDLDYLCKNGQMTILNSGWEGKI